MGGAEYLVCLGSGWNECAAPLDPQPPGRRLRAAGGSVGVCDMEAPLDGLPVRGDGLITSADATAVGAVRGEKGPR